MFDLFGESITTPAASTTRKTSAINASHGFIEWWLTYPKTSRKVAKQQCLDKWARLQCADIALHVKQHTEWMKSQPDWIKDNGSFICAPLVYLNQQRWADWEPSEALKKPNRDPELAKRENDVKQAKKPSAEILAAIAKIKQGIPA